MTSRARIVAAALVLALAGCSDVPSGEDTTATLPTTTTTAAPTTAGPSSSTAATTTTTAPPATTTTLAYDGIPATLPLPVAGILTLTGGDRFTDGFVVAGSTGEAVFGWLVETLPSAGWEVTEQTSDPGTRRRGFQATIEFVGRGASGVLELTQRPSGVAVEITLLPRHDVTS
jgi:glucose/arabinose dehydrogenase